MTISTSHVIDSAKIDLIKSIPAVVATLAKLASGGTQMSNDQDLSQEGKKAPTVDSHPESDTNEPGSDEIIELTDVVDEGKDPFESDLDAALLLDEEEPDHDPIKLPEDITVEGLEPPSFAAEKTDPAVVASDTPDSAEMKEAFPGDDFSPLESSDFKFEDSSAFEAADAEPFPAQSQENLDDVLAGLEKEASAFEKPEDILADLEKDELEDEKPIDVPAGPAVIASDTLAEWTLDGNDKADKKPEETAATRDIPGISEERMKELLTEVIQETVDKAVRETVSEVAEKVIQEAIDALKQSIASSGAVSASEP